MVADAVSRAVLKHDFKVSFCHSSWQWTDYSDAAFELIDGKKKKNVYISKREW